MPTRGPSLRPLVVGANHRSAAVATREALFLTDARATLFLARLREAGIPQAVVMSTCDRVEVQAAVADPDEAARRIAALLADEAGLDAGRLAAELYLLNDEAAVRHLFLVAAALDSQVVGEPNVAGQMKDAHRAAREAGMTGSELEAVFQAAYASAKRVRSETAVGEGAVSIAAAAAEIAREVHGDLGRCAALLAGGGEMGVLIAERLLRAGLGRLTVACRARGRAEMLARAWSCHHAPFEGIGQVLPEADIVVTAQASGVTLFGKEAVRDALAKRRQRPMYLVDAAVPSDIDRAAGDVEGAFLYSLDDLEELARQGLAGRAAAAAAAREIVEREVEEFLGGRAGRTASATVTALRAKFAEAREAALKEAGNDAERATRLMMNRLLHEPSAALRAIGAAGGAKEAEALVRRLFGLEDEEH